MANAKNPAETGSSVKFSTIVLPTDFSANSQAAVPYAVELAKNGGEIFLLNVFEDIESHAMLATSGTGVALDWTGFIEEMRQQHAKKLKAEAAALGASGVKVKSIMVDGYAAEAIVAFAREKKADCIVIATHGRSGLSHLFYGSVAERVVRFSECPVLSVKPAKVERAKSKGS